MAFREHFDHTHEIDRPTVADQLAASVAAVRSIPTVYPGYIAFKAKQGILAALTDPKLDAPIVADVGDIQSLGNSRYGIAVTDHNGTTYRVTVEIAGDA